MKTLKQIRDKVIDDLDLYEETFVDDAELDNLINEGIKKVEAIIHTLYEDYFLATSTIVLAQDQNLYDFPVDMYANKLRTLIYSDGSVSYEIKRVTDLQAAIAYDLVDDITSRETMRWYPMNNSADGRKVRIFPKTADTGSMEMWYIRRAKQLVDDTDISDIPEFIHVVEYSVKAQVLFKDGDPRATDMAGLEREAVSAMTQTLSDMVVDNNNEVEGDYSHYMESY